MSDQAIYKNDDWVVYTDRMEATDGSYTLHGHIGEKREGTDQWDWPLHMAEKTWFNIKTFAPAFFELLKATKTPVDAGLLMTFYEIAEGVTREKLFDQAAKDLNAVGPGGALDFRRMVDIDAEVQRRLGN